MPPVSTQVVRVVRKPAVQALIQVARWLLGKGRELWQTNLTERERQEFTELLARSRGRRRNLTDQELARLAKLVSKALTGDDGFDVGDVIAIGRAAK